MAENASSSSVQTDAKETNMSLQGSASRCVSRLVGKALVQLWPRKTTDTEKRQGLSYMLKEKRRQPNLGRKTSTGNGNERTTKLHQIYTTQICGKKR